MLDSVYASSKLHETVKTLQQAKKAFQICMMSLSNTGWSWNAPITIFFTFSQVASLQVIFISTKEDDILHIIIVCGGDINFFSFCWSFQQWITSLYTNTTKEIFAANVSTYTSFWIEYVVIKVTNVPYINVGMKIFIIS